MSDSTVIPIPDEDRHLVDAWNVMFVYQADEIVPLTSDRLHAWRVAFPRVKLEASFETIADWLDRNPTKRWKPRGTIRGVMRWLTKENEKAEAEVVASSSTGTAKKTSPHTLEMERQRFDRERKHHQKHGKIARKKGDAKTAEWHDSEVAWREGYIAEIDQSLKLGATYRHKAP